jgi:hypothetical protein
MIFRKSKTDLVLIPSGTISSIQPNPDMDDFLWASAAPENSQLRGYKQSSPSGIVVYSIH